MQLKSKHLVLLTYGVNAHRKSDFREERQLRRNQLAHVDAPTIIEGLPDDVDAFLTTFVTLTERVENSLFFEMSCCKERLGVRTKKPTSGFCGDCILHTGVLLKCRPP